MNRRRDTIGIYAAIVALVVAFGLDPWAWVQLQYPPVYERDWGRLLRVMGSLVLWLPLAVAVWLEARARDPSRSGRSWLLLFGPAVAGGMAEVLKIVIRRERPGLHDGEYFFRPFADRLFDTRNLGLPSSHTMVAFGGATIVARLFPRAAPVAYLLAAGCGITRVLARAHFLSDVVAGAIAGWAVAALLWWWFDRAPAEKPSA